MTSASPSSIAALQAIVSPRPAFTPSNPTAPFIPKEAGAFLDTKEMIAIVGGPGTGKSSSILWNGGFPNRIWFDFDRNLPRAELPNAIPFWNSEFCDKLATPTQGFKCSNRRDAFLIWLRDNHRKFTSEQTVILDSWSLFMDAFDEQTREEEARLPKNKEGAINNYWFFDRKREYAQVILTTLKACAARVIVTFHEAPDRNDKGLLTGKIRPLIEGMMKDKIFGYFTDAWRMVVNPYKLDSMGQRINQGSDFAREAGFYWQVIRDDVVECKMNANLGVKVRAAGKRYIKAEYTELERIYNT